MTKKIAVVTFPNTDRFSNSYGKNYNFITDLENLEKGDTLVADTINGLQIVEFVKYDELGFGHTGTKQPTKWIVQKVDLEKHKQRIEDAEELQKLKIMMENQRKKAQELEIYEILAKQDPTMAELLDKYKTLQELI